MKSKLALLLLLTTTLISCGADKIQPAPDAIIQQNRSAYQDFITEFNGVSKAVALTRLDQFQFSKSDQANTFNKYATQIESSALFNLEYDYIEGFLYRAGEEILRTMVATLLKDSGLGILSSTNNGVVDAYIEDPESGLYEYKINQHGAYVTGCDDSQVDCYVDLNLHVRLNLSDTAPTLSSQPGLFSYRFTIPQISISILEFELSNSQIRLMVPASEQAANIEEILFDFDILAGQTGVAIKVAGATSAVKFELSENIESGILFNGSFTGTLDQANLNFSRIDENIVVVSDLENLDVAIEGDASALLSTQIDYHFWSDSNSLANSTDYPFQLGLSMVEPPSPPAIDLNWTLDLDITQNATALLSINGGGHKQNKYNFQIDQMNISGALLNSDYLLTAKIEDSAIINIDAQSRCIVSFIRNRGVLIDPMEGAVASITLDTSLEYILNFLESGD